MSPTCDSQLLLPGFVIVMSHRETVLDLHALRRNSYTKSNAFSFVSLKFANGANGVGSKLL